MNRYSNNSESRLVDIQEWLNGDKDLLNIIEFGVGSGRTLNELQRQYPNSKLLGFDISPPSLSNEIRLIRADLNQLKPEEYLPEISNADAFLFLDVLEHLNEPFRMIPEILKNAKPGSRMIISSPNFASVRMFLAWLGGRMPLNEFGYFDRTHLHWLSNEDDFFKTLKVSKIIKTYVYSKKFYFKFLQKIIPKRLCSQLLIIIVK